MKKILYFLGSLTYGFLISYAIWLIFYFITPWIMSFGWLALIAYWFITVGLIGGLLISISSIVFAPLLVMVEKCKLAKYIPALTLLFAGYSSAAMPWRLNITYSTVKIISATSISLTASILFISFIILLFKKI